MPARKLRRKKIIMASAFVSAFTLLSLGGLTAFLALTIRLVKVPSESMLSTLQPGDIVAIRIDAYKHASPKRGDIIVFHDRKDGSLLIKRVVGLPGEHVYVWSGLVFINGAMLEEPYIQGHFVLELPIRRFLQKNEFWVMGDNRSQSNDSRDFGPVKREQIVGKAVAIIWPLERRGRLEEYRDVMPSP